MLRPDFFSFEKLDSLSPDTNSSSGVKEHHDSTLKRVAVEGNIGCGKTTFLEHFKNREGVEVLKEPVDKWKSVNGFNCFDLMYKDAMRWSPAFQSYVALTMLENHEQKEVKKVKMIERTLYSARYCFVENLHKKKLMSDVDYAVLNEWHDWIRQNADTGLDLIVYMRARPETCQERIRVRSREEESSIPLDYLQDLHALHEDWLYHRTRGQLPCPVLVVDADKDLDEVLKTIERLTPQILCQDS